eukprot:7755159-Lingulodinium_polyedra.AAC.1
MTPQPVIKSYCHRSCQPVVSRSAGASEGSWHSRHLPLVSSEVSVANSSSSAAARSVLTPSWE